MSKMTAGWGDDELDRLAELIADKIAARESQKIDFLHPEWHYYHYTPYYPGPYWWQSPVTSTWREG